jgi:hypothetical protein
MNIYTHAVDASHRKAIEAVKRVASLEALAADGLFGSHSFEMDCPVLIST